MKDAGSLFQFTRSVALLIGCTLSASGCVPEPHDPGLPGERTLALTAAVLVAGDAVQLRSRISEYKAGYDAGQYGSGTITLTADTWADCADGGGPAIVLEDVHNLEIRGQVSSERIELHAATCSGATVAIRGGANVVVRDLDLYKPAGNNTRAIETFGTSTVGIKTMRVLAEPDAG